MKTKTILLSDFSATKQYNVFYSIMLIENKCLITKESTLINIRKNKKKINYENNENNTNSNYNWSRMTTKFNQIL